MDELPGQFRHYTDYSISPTYALGHAHHGLASLTAKTPVHGRHGVRAVLGELFTTLAALDLVAATGEATPLRGLHDRLALRPRFARLGAAALAEIRTVVPRIQAAVQAELRARSGRRQRSAGVSAATLLKRPREVLGKAAYGRLPAELRWDLSEGCRAIGQRLFTAGVFHLYRVWIGLHAGHADGGVPPLPVADPGRDPSVRCTERDAVTVFVAVQRTLQPPEPVGQ